MRGFGKAVIHDSVACIHRSAEARARRCNKRIQGYDHFGSGSCVLFDPEEVARYNAMLAAQGRSDVRHRDTFSSGLHA